MSNTNWKYANSYSEYKGTILIAAPACACHQAQYMWGILCGSEPSIAVACISRPLQCSRVRDSQDPVTKPQLENSIWCDPLNDCCAPMVPTRSINNEHFLADMKMIIRWCLICLLLYTRTKRSWAIMLRGCLINPRSIQMHVLTILPIYFCSQRLKCYTKSLRTQLDL